MDLYQRPGTGVVWEGKSGVDTCSHIKHCLVVLRRLPLPKDFWMIPLLCKFVGKSLSDPLQDDVTKAETLGAHELLKGALYTEFKNDLNKLFLDRH